jgi:hypothetical protein
MDRHFRSGQSSQSKQTHPPMGRAPLVVRELKGPLLLELGKLMQLQVQMALQK